MSIKQLADRGGQYQVRWREGGRQRSRLFARRGDAQAFELDVRRRQALGPLAATVTMSRVTLAEFVREEWWPRYAVPNLAPDTQRRYLECWGHDLLPRLGGYELGQITPLMVEDLRDQLRAQGLAPASQRKALLLLSGILKRAVVRGLIPRNAVSQVQMPKAPPAAAPQPLAPETVERIRQVMLSPRERTVPASAPGRRPTRAYTAPVGSPRERQRNALIVSMLAYGGFRPVEDRSARWGDLHDRSLYVLSSKTRSERYVDLLSPLAQDLAEWRLASGRPSDDQLIVARPSGGEWTKGDWDNWRSRVWRPAVLAAGVTGDLRPYRLRGSFVSLLLWSGMDLVEVSGQSGHSVATLARHYAGVIRELKGRPRVPASEAIRHAREAASDQLQLVGR
ncbi:MAG TPA: tyrosine-type recombinase/integrase [Solirubrobacteraceae bacterium]|jgi:integrase|nr:tyrosine-type recombinase/integrase [Solirubrobacteraceae bacterium]